MNGFNCTFHDLRHTFATMMIGSGCDVQTVASYLGHTSVSMTLDIYADVDPETKIVAVSKVEGAFGLDMDRIVETEPTTTAPPDPGVVGITFTVGQLEAMLATTKAKEPGHAGI